MRKLGFVLLGIIVLIVVALLVAPAFINVDQYRGRIQAELQNRLGRPVSFGALHLRLLPFKVLAENVVVGEDPQFNTGRPFAQAQRLAISARLLPLLHGAVDIRSLDLEHPTVELVRNQAGVWNFSTIGAPKGDKPSAQQPAPSKTGQNLSLAALDISDGTVAITDFQKHQSRAVYDHIDLTLSDFAPGKPFSLSAAAHLPGTGKQTFQLDGTAGPINDSSLVATPFDGKLKLDQVAVSSLQKFLNTDALKDVDASITGTANVRNQAGKLASDGMLRFDNAHLHGTEVGYPITADYKASDDLNKDFIRIDEGTIKLGATPLTIVGTVDAHPSPSVLDLHVTTKNASITELTRLAAAAGIAFNPNTKVDGRITADVYAKGASDKPALSGRVSSQDVSVSGKDLPKPVQVKAIELALTPQQVQSNPFTVSTGGTSLNAQFTMAQYTTPSPTINLSLNTANANLAEVLNIAQAYGVKAAEGMNGSGTLDLNVRASGPINKPDALQYAGSGRLANASLQPASLTQPLKIRNVALQFTQNSVVMQDLAASLGQTNANGSLTLRNFAAPNVQFSLSADKVNVAELQNITKPTPPRAGEKAKASPLEDVTGGGSVSVGQIVYDQLVLNNVKSTVVLDRGVIRFTPTTAQLYGGGESGGVTVDTRTTPARVQVAMNLQHVDANQLLSSVSSLKQTLYGLLAANANTNFTLGSSASDIARSLNGTMALNLTNGKIAHVDLLNELSSIGRFASGGVPQAQPFTNLVKLAGNFNVQNGVAATQNLVAQIEGGSLSAQGTANLVNNALDMHVTAVLSNAMSQKVGGTGIGGFMQTALANRSGELVIPVLVSGTFDHPKFAPDVQKLAQMKLQNILPTANNPAGGIVGAILGGAAGQNGQGAQPGAQGVVGGILGALGGRQQQQQPQRQPQNAPVAAPQGQQPQAQPAPQQPPNVGDLVQGLINRSQKKKDQPPPQPPPQR